MKRVDDCFFTYVSKKSSSSSKKHSWRDDSTRTDRPLPPRTQAQVPHSRHHSSSLELTSSGRSLGATNNSSPRSRFYPLHTHTRWTVPKASALPCSSSKLGCRCVAGAGGRVVFAPLHVCTALRNGPVEQKYQRRGCTSIICRLPRLAQANAFKLNPITVLESLCSIRPLKQVISHERCQFLRPACPASHFSPAVGVGCASFIGGANARSQHVLTVWS